VQLKAVDSRRRKADRPSLAGRISAADYLALPEQLLPQELVWGVVREPPAPRYGHQAVVGHVFRELSAHVRARDLGIVMVSPLDVVLDPRRGLVVQPDVLFVSKARLDIIDDQVWGAPDLVVEVASRRTARRDRTTKLRWYRAYGVGECWLLDPGRERVTVVDLRASGRKGIARFTGGQRIRSLVLPELKIEAAACFD
jgi:Uma2 family endonuclease